METRYRYFHLSSKLVFFILISISNLSFANSALDNAWKQIEQKDFLTAQHILLPWIKENPNDIEAQYLYTRCLAWNKQHDEAIDSINKLIKHQPKNSDFLLTKARILSWKKKIDQALKTLDIARNISPDYKEVWDFELKLIENNSHYSNKYNQLQQDYSLQFSKPYQAQKIKRDIPLKKTDYLLVGTSYEKLDTSSNDWHTTLIEYGTKIKSYNINLTLENSRRFGLTDNQITINSSKSFSRTVDITSAISKSNQNTLYSNWRFLIKAQKTINKVNVLSYQWIHRKYTNTIVDTSNISISRYWGPLVPGLAANITAINNKEVTLSYSAKLAWFITDEDFIRLSLSQGTEGEYIGNTLTLEKIQFVGLDGRWNFSTNWNAILAIGQHKQGKVYIKNGIFLGLQRRF